MKNYRFAFKLVVLACVFCVCTTPSFAWGKKGHDVTCAIAQRHLSRKAAKKVNQIFKGKSMVYWSNWMDNASHTPEFAYTKTWHYKNIDANETYENALREPAGDVVTAIAAQIKALKSGELNPEQTEISLRMLVHLVGDLHCPMHMGHKSDLGGNKWQVRYFNSGKNIHGVWDSELIEGTHKWTYTEWANEVDTASKDEIKEITVGSLDDWGKQTYMITTRIYDSTPVGSKLSYDYVSEWTPVVEEQLLRGGLRLAYILNDIYR